MPFDGTNLEVQLKPETLLLMRARQKLERRWGWCQGRRRSFYGAHCVVGAIIGGKTARQITSIERRALVYLGSAIFYTDDIYLSELFTWNDRPGRMHGDVIQALDKAIALSKTYA